mgnify:CR=1 FL=1
MHCAAGRAHLFEERGPRRVFQLHIVTTLGDLAGDLAVPTFRGLVEDHERVGASSLFGANLYFHGAVDYFNAPIETQPLLHLLSLGVEEQAWLDAQLATPMPPESCGKLSQDAQKWLEKQMQNEEDKDMLDDARQAGVLQPFPQPCCACIPRNPPCT